MRTARQRRLRRSLFGQPSALRMVRAIALATLFSLVATGPGSAAALHPTPSQAPHDVESIWGDGCVAFEGQITPDRSCVYGDTSSSYKVALIGDSHASHMFPAFQKVANQRGWRLYVFVKIDCPFLDIAIKSAHTFEAYPACTKWNKNLVALLKDIKPNLTVTMPLRWIYPVNSANDTPEKEGEAMGRELAKVPGERVVFVDTPWSNRDVPTCLKSHSRSYCAIPRGQAIGGHAYLQEQTAANVAGGSLVDLTQGICGGFPCRVVTNDILMFRDRHHLTATYSRFIAPLVDSGLKSVGV